MGFWFSLTLHTHPLITSFLLILTLMSLSCLLNILLTELHHIPTLCPTHALSVVFTQQLKGTLIAFTPGQLQFCFFFFYACPLFSALPFLVSFVAPAIFATSFLHSGPGNGTSHCHPEALIGPFCLYSTLSLNFLGESLTFTLLLFCSASPYSFLLSPFFPFPSNSHKLHMPGSLGLSLLCLTIRITKT